MNHYQAFKDYIEVLTPRGTLKKLEPILQGQLDTREIAYTIYETKGICPLCDDTGIVQKKKCPVCRADIENHLNYHIRRDFRYRLILKHIFHLWDAFINEE